MKTSKKDISKLSSENEKLKSTLDNIGDFFHEVSVESKFGAEMINQNITTDFVNKIDQFQKNPLDHTFELFQYVGKDVQSLLNEQVVNYFIENKSLIKKVIKAYGNSLIYTIVLKEDNLTNRSKFLNFLNDYKETKVSKQFNIIFNFLPIQFEEHIKSQHQVVYQN
jgi:hypothetical protein